MTGPNRTQNMLSRLSVMDRMASAICHGPASLLDVKLVMTHRFLLRSWG